MKLRLIVLAATATLVLSGGCVPPAAPTGTAPPEPTATEEPTTPPKPECLTELAGPSDSAALEAIKPWTEDWIDFEDPLGDFLLDHPLFEENFAELIRGSGAEPGDVYNRAVIPPALDMTTIRVGPEGEYVMFEIGMARYGTPDGSRGETLRDLLQPGRRKATIGIYVDVDRNGISDYLWTTTDEKDTGVLLSPSVDEPVAVLGEGQTRVSDDSIVAFLPREIVGEKFDWLAFTGYSPVDNAYFRSPLDWVFFVPEVDVFYPQDLPAMIGFSTSYSGTGVQCQVTGAFAAGSVKCPPEGNPASTPVPGTSYQGVLMYKVQCNGRGYGLWCINPRPGFFGKAVFNPSLLGWIARCPFHCGWNEEGRWDQDSDGLVDKIFHTITDLDCGSYHDKDGDGYLDVMEHTYLYAGNKLVSCNREREYQQPNVVVGNPRCKPPQTPYSDPASVPEDVPTPTPVP